MDLGADYPYIQTRLLVNGLHPHVKLDQGAVAIQVKYTALELCARVGHVRLGRRGREVRVTVRADIGRHSVCVCEGKRRQRRDQRVCVSVLSNLSGKFLFALAGQRFQVCTCDFVRAGFL